MLISREQYLSGKMSASDVHKKKLQYYNFEWAREIKKPEVSFV